MLVKELFDSCVLVEGAEPRELIDDRKVPTDQISMAFRFSIAMHKGRLEETKLAVSELVEMRNDMVHHLIEHFDLWDDRGCHAAIEHLNESYQRIDAHYGQLQEWAVSLVNARKMSAEFAKSEAFRSLIVDGIAPNGTFEWADSGIVRVLREGLKHHAIDGWAPLKTVSQWAGELYPHQIPKKYQRRSWPQVLNESGLFDTTYRIDGAGQREAWFRERRPIS